jgi:hypothetical protein
MVLIRAADPRTRTMKEGYNERQVTGRLFGQGLTFWEPWSSAVAPSSFVEGRMKSFPGVGLASRVAVVLGAALAASPADAAFHLWKVQEAFTNYDGSVQFVELTTQFAGQNFLAGHTLTATSDGTAVVYTMPANISNSNAGATLLLATAGFGALMGGGGVAVTPDYPAVPLPNKFFDPNAASITLNFSNLDSITCAGSAIPKDGLASVRDLILGAGQQLHFEVNSPRNSSNQIGFVNLPPAGDFDENLRVNAADLPLWRSGFGASVAATHMQGDANGDGDVDGDDFLVWQRNLGILHQDQVPVTAGVPEPRSIAILGAALFMVLAQRSPIGPLSRRRRR